MTILMLSVGVRYHYFNQGPDIDGAIKDERRQWTYSDGLVAPGQSPCEDITGTRSIERETEISLNKPHVTNGYLERDQEATMRQRDGKRRVCVNCTRFFVECLSILQERLTNIQKLTCTRTEAGSTIRRSLF
jgi:hypothetical protein